MALAEGRVECRPAASYPPSPEASSAAARALSTFDMLPSAQMHPDGSRGCAGEPLVVGCRAGSPAVKGMFRL
jgi:hypothetical protein